MRQRCVNEFGLLPSSGMRWAIAADWMEEQSKLELDSVSAAAFRSGLAATAKIYSSGRDYGDGDGDGDGNGGGMGRGVAGDPTRFPQVGNIDGHGHGNGDGNGDGHGKVQPSPGDGHGHGNGDGGGDAYGSARGLTPLPGEPQWED